MKKKLLIIIFCIFVLFLILSIIVFTSKDKKEKNIYKNYTIDNYSFKVLDKYNYKYDKDKKIGYLNNELFLKSYIYVSPKKYKNLISISAYYGDMGGKEVDSNIEEIKIGDYDAFINIKEIEYKDVEDHNYLVIILIKLEDEKTFVFQYEIKNMAKEEQDTILKNVKYGLKDIELKN